MEPILHARYPVTQEVYFLNDEFRTSALCGTVRVADTG